MFGHQCLRFGLFFSAVAVAALLLQPTKAQRPQTSLPGARAEIDAANYGSLQAAIDALPPEGGCLRIPAGRFEILKPLVVEVGDVLITGQGTASELVNVNQSGEPCLIVRPKRHAIEPKATLWRVQIANLRLTGNEKSGHGVEAIHVNEIFIHGVTVSYHGGDGIRLDHCYEDPRIGDSLITYNKQAGLNLLGCHDIVVSSNQFEENQDAVRCSDGFNLCMNGNNIDDHLRHGVVIENTYGSVVSGNMIEECQGVGIVLDRDCYGITLAANVIAHEFSGGIDLLDAHGCTVSANSFPLVHKHALFIGPESDRIAVTGNAFADSFLGRGATRRPPPDDPSGGIVLSGTRDIAISGNTFSGLAYPAVALEGEQSRRILFRDNLLTGAKSEHEKLTESEVSGNLVDTLDGKAAD